MTARPEKLRQTSALWLLWFRGVLAGKNVAFGSPRGLGASVMRNFTAFMINNDKIRKELACIVCAW